MKGFRRVGVFFCPNHRTLDKSSFVTFGKEAVYCLELGLQKLGGVFENEVRENERGESLFLSVCHGKATCSQYFLVFTINLIVESWNNKS